VIVGQRIEAVTETVFVQQRCNDHGVDDAAIDFEACRFDPAQVVLGVVHDLVGRAFENFFEPPIDDLFVEVATAHVADW
jgi:hypothetical protein